MKKLTGILITLCFTIYLQNITAKHIDDRETFEEMIEALIKDQTHEIIEVSRDNLQTETNKDFQSGIDDKENNENIVRAIEMILMSKRSRKGEDKQLSYQFASDENSNKRSWFTADVVHKGTNGTTPGTPSTTPPQTPPPTTTPKQSKHCFWIWFRRICF